MPQAKILFGDLYAFALRERSNGDIPNFKILENKVLWHILPVTVYLAMKNKHRSLIRKTTIKILCHKPHTAFLTISPTNVCYTDTLPGQW